METKNWKRMRRIRALWSAKSWKLSSFIRKNKTIRNFRRGMIFCLPPLDTKKLFFSLIKITWQKTLLNRNEWKKEWVISSLAQSTWAKRPQRSVWKLELTWLRELRKLITRWVEAQDSLRLRMRRSKRLGNYWIAQAIEINWREWSFWLRYDMIIWVFILFINLEFIFFKKLILKIYWFYFIFCFVDDSTIFFFSLAFLCFFEKQKKTKNKKELCIY